MPGATSLVGIRQSIAVLPRLVSTAGGGVPGNFSTTTATQSVTVKADDLVVVPCASGASTRNVTGITGGTGISWTQSAVQTAASNSYIQVFTGRATTTETFTLTATFNNSSATVPVWFEPLVFEDVGAVGAVASHAGSTNASVSLTTTADYSAVLHIAGDFNGTAVAARTYSTATAGPATELAYVTAATAGQLTVGCDYYVNADVAGAKTIGFTAPTTGTFWSAIAIELQPTHLSQTVDATGQGIPSGEAVGVATIPPPLLSTVVDTFSGGSIDTTIWTAPAATGTATGSIVSGQLSMALSASSHLSLHLVTTTIYSYDSAYVAITLPTGTINANWSAYLRFNDNDGNASQYKIGLINGGWNQSVFNGGATTVTSLGVGAPTSGQTLWVRFRNTGTGNGSQWAFDTSSDGTTWTQSALTPFSASFDSTQPLVYLASDTGTTAGTFLFDNFNTTPTAGSPQTVTGVGVASAEAEGVATVTSAITLAGTGIATAEAEGVAVVTPGAATVTGVGVATAEAEGVAVVTPGAVTVTGVGIATAEAEGVAVVTPGAVTVTGVGVASAQAAGVAVVTPGAVTVTGTGVATAEAEGVGTVTSAITLTGTGVASAEAEGVATVTPGAVTVTGVGIATSEAEGVATVTPGPVALTGTGVASGEAEGVGTVTSAVTLAGTGVASGEAEGVAVVQPGPVTLTGTGVASAQAAGVAVVTPGAATITGVGVASAEAEGVALVSVVGGPVTVVGVGIATSEAVGVAAVQPGPVTVTGVGVASGEAEGVAAITSLTTLTGTGAASAEAEGVATLQPGPVTITGVGIASAEAAGVATLTSVVRIVGTGIPSAEAEGVGTVISTAGLIGGIGIPSGETVGLASIVTLTRGVRRVTTRVSSRTTALSTASRNTSWRISSRTAPVDISIETASTTLSSTR